MRSSHLLWLRLAAAAGHRLSRSIFIKVMNWQIAVRFQPLPDDISDHVIARHLEFAGKML